MAAQARLSNIQGRDRVWLCGSYCGFGFHEDALASGLAVASALGTPREWMVRDVSPAFANATPAAR
jgi:predicted NAD/FAD-binding protein